MFPGLLDFPSVNVTAHEDGHVLFHFIHPWMLSKLSTTPMEETSQDSELPEFMYYVDVKNQVRKDTFSYALNIVMALMTQYLLRK